MRLHSFQLCSFIIKWVEDVLHLSEPCNCCCSLLFSIPGFCYNTQNSLLSHSLISHFGYILRTYIKVDTYDWRQWYKRVQRVLWDIAKEIKFLSFGQGKSGKNYICMQLHKCFTKNLWLMHVMLSFLTWTLLREVSLPLFLWKDNLSVGISHSCTILHYGCTCCWTSWVCLFDVKCGYPKVAECKWYVDKRANNTYDFRKDIVPMCCLSPVNIAIQLIHNICAKSKWKNNKKEGTTKCPNIL
jgi:hypothetical protein